MKKVYSLKLSNYIINIHIINRQSSANFACAQEIDPTYNLVETINAN